MSCDVAASAAILLAAFAPAHGSGAARFMTIADVRMPARGTLQTEPLYADIVGRARALKAQADAYRRGASGGAPALPGFEDFRARIAALSDLDMKGHMDLAARGTDGDLKCILKGISQDLPKKLAEVAAAADPAARETALRDLAYLLNDNVEVVTAPPAPPV